MMLPTPTSARLVVRRTHATCIEEVGRLYAGVVGSWLREEHIDEAVLSGEKGEKAASVAAPDPSPFSVEMQKRSRARMLALYVKLKGIKTSISQAGFEVSLRGDWPEREYSELLERQLAVVGALSQVGLSLIHLDPTWRRLLVTRTAFLNPNLVRPSSALSSSHS